MSVLGDESGRSPRRRAALTPEAAVRGQMGRVQASPELLVEAGGRRSGGEVVKSGVRLTADM